MGLSPRVRGNRVSRRPHHDIVRSIPACAGEPRQQSELLSCHSVYPRVCGGTSAKFVAYCTVRGLSPHVGGNHTRRLGTPLYLRSIPACAGEPHRSRPPGPSGRVYPRVCGGTYLISIVHRIRAGLSPRVRGNHGPAESDRPCHGSIPACAGEPLGQRGEIRAHQVYPRVCGGTIDASGISHWTKGLSPRVRGNHRGGVGVVVGEGSIPACAGEP